MTRILVIEDNADLAYGLRNNLEIEGYDVDVAHDGAGGLHAATVARPDLILLDLMLPDIDGHRVLRDLRAQGIDAPVLMLTARAEEADKVRALRLGADDYVTKPFGVLELLARIEAVLRRVAPAAPDTIVFGDVTLRPGSRIVTRAGQPVALTPMELDLLMALIARRGNLVTRLELLTEVWGHSAAVLTRTIDTHVAELRRKLEPDPAKPRFIHTVRKAGYRFDPAG
jgi:DNA-binding response OmpR family regulator